MVLQTFAEGKVVYRRLCYEGATRLLDTVADRMRSDWEGDSRGVPGNKAQKRQLMTALLQCIAEEESAKPAPAPAPTAPLAASPASGSPGPALTTSLPTVTVSAAVSRKLVFYKASIDTAGIAALLQVYLDGYSGFFPFIKYFPLPTCDPSLPAQFCPDQEQQPRWEGSYRDAWDKRKDLVFEVCKQASAFNLQQAVNAGVPVVEACRQEEHKQSKKKFVVCVVSMDLRTAASKAAALLQDAM